MTPFSRPLYGFRFVEVRIGDSLQAIAARELGDASRWHELIAYNNLVPPFLTDDPALASQGVKTAGELILVPAPAPSVSTGVDPEKVFERDIDLTGGQFSVENGDFAVVAGRANLRQAIKHRIDTERGELMFHLAYGSSVRRMIGAVNGPTAAQLAASYARAAVAMDPRVRQVLSATAEVVGDAVNVTVVAEPIAGESVEVAAAL